MCISGRGGPHWNPVRVGNATDWASVATGYTYTCGIRLDHTLWCWGANSDHQLGIVDVDVDGRQFQPVQVGTDTDWADIIPSALERAHTCGLRTDGTLWC